MAVLIPPHATRGRALGLLAVAVVAVVALCGCALPGPPRPPRPPSPTSPLAPSSRPDCPTLTVVEVNEDGLRLNITLPPASRAAPAALPVTLAVVMTTDGATATERLTVRLDGRLDAVRRAGGALALLDAQWTAAQSAQPTSLRVQLGFALGVADVSDDGAPPDPSGDAAPDDAACEASAWVLLPAVGPGVWPEGLDAPPTLDAVGRAVSIHPAPSGEDLDLTGDWRIFRRGLAGEGDVVVARGWRPSRDGVGGGFVDVGAEPGRVYAYSVAREVEVVDGGARLRVVGPRSPEGYVVIALPPEP